MNWRNPLRLADGRIDCEVEQPGHGWLPYTADPDDVEQPSRELHQAILDAEAAGEVTIADAPPPDPGPPELSPRRFEWLLAFTGLDDVWDAVQARAKAEGDRRRYAGFKAERMSGRFDFSAIRAFAGDPAVQAAAAERPHIDLSDAALRRAWDLAADAKG